MAKVLYHPRKLARITERCRGYQASPTTGGGIRIHAEAFAVLLLMTRCKNHPWYIVYTYSETIKRALMKENERMDHLQPEEEDEVM